MPVGPKGRSLRARLARQSRDCAPDHPEVVTLRRDYLAEVCAERVAEIVSTAPPFTDDQVERIIGVLRGGAL
ncbi:hypothetical protein MN2019_17915 [Mycolicibacterium neoaurum]|uniref:hypothetical protein n=1 Tax=Mycolicibacterium neoaurum TaxID=1795 RepID=UPI001BCF7175|nr:hypothetical protein [Mycolicibacterium neoaurum]QVI26179.1 hypothetical protein MN2019_17915 [Mycolicibacterium neoaurum]